MFLHTLTVKNYRAVQKGQITFDKSIAVIGENDSGKSSLLDALCKMLDARYINDGFRPELRHFYHKPDQSTSFEPIRMQLVFEERNAGDWNTSIYSPIQNLLNSKAKYKEKLILQFSAYYNLDKSIHQKWLIINPSNNKQSNNTEVINWLRRINPTISLSAGLLTGHGVNNLPDIPSFSKDNPFPAHLQEHVANVRLSSKSLLSGTSIHVNNDAEKGYVAALKLNDYLSQLKAFEGINLSIKKHATPNKTAQQQKRKVPVAKTGSNSEKIGAILVMNALINACGNTNLSEVDPIWIIEDPEAHLHKITLAAVSNIIKGINGQKVITTNSGGLLATMPLHQVRRLMRNNGIINEYYVKKNALSHKDIRRVNYHVRTHRNSAFFSRVWLLVEGETEFWILPRIARILGYDFRLEGITCVEYAQSGLRPLLKIAEELNIKWLMLSDGDNAGFKYANQAENYVEKAKASKQICVFPAKDIEHYFWENGFDHVYIKQSRTRVPRESMNKSRTIKSAIKNYSKPHMALAIVDAASGENGTPIPKELVELIENCVLAARQAVL